MFFFFSTERYLKKPTHFDVSESRDLKNVPLPSKPTVTQSKVLFSRNRNNDLFIRIIIILIIIIIII